MTTGFKEVRAVCDRSLFPDPTLGLSAEWKGSISEKIREQPEASIALYSTNESWTYGELNNAADRLKDFIASHVDPPTPVCLYAERSAVLVVALLATIRSGTPFVILDSSLPETRLRQCLEIAIPGLLINVSGNELPVGLQKHLSHRDGNVRILDCGNSKSACLQKISTFAVSRKNTLPAKPGDLLYLTFTSGTTGYPKAVLGEQAPVSHFFDWQQRKFDLNPSDRISVLSGLGHDPFLRDTLLALWVGASAWVPPLDCYTTPGRLFVWLFDSEITVCHLTPSLCQMILASGPKIRAKPLHTLRLVCFGGEPLKYSLARKFKEIAPNAVLVNCYGATETPQVIAQHVLSSAELSNGESEPFRGLVPVGRGIDDVQLLVLDNQGSLCSPRKEGQIWVRTPFLAREVWDHSRTPQSVFKANPFRRDPSDRMYATGDYGYFDENGTVHFMGRRDSQVKLRGHRVELKELDRVIESFPELAGFHCELSELSSGEGQILTLYLVPVNGIKIDSNRIREELKRRLPDYMLPDVIQIVSNLPLTANGKVDHAALGAIGVKGANFNPISESYDACLAKLSKLISTHLGVANFSADQPLTSLGLNSLQGVLLCCAIEETFGVACAFQDVASGTPRTLAARIEVLQSRGPSKWDASREMKDRSETTTATSSPKSEPFLTLPRNEGLFRAVLNRFLQLIARVSPDSLRVRCHRWRGVSIGHGVSIGYDSIIETAYPHLVTIGNHANLGMRTLIIAHFRGMGSLEKGAFTVKIEENVFIGPNVTILPNVVIGKGSVISAGSVVNSSIPPFTMAHGNPARPTARCGIPLTGDTEYSEFLKHLEPL